MLPHSQYICKIKHNSNITLMTHTRVKPKSFQHP